MTTKELLYIEDALGHAKYFQTKCQETANQIQDTELPSFPELLRPSGREERQTWTTRI